MNCRIFKLILGCFQRLFLCLILLFIDIGPYLQPGETGAIIVSGGQIISNKGAKVENLATVEVLREDGTPWCTLPSLPYSRHEYSEQGLSDVHFI